MSKKTDETIYSQGNTVYAGGVPIGKVGGTTVANNGGSSSSSSSSSNLGSSSNGGGSRGSSDPDAGLSMDSYRAKYGVAGSSGGSSGSGGTSDYINRVAELKKVAANADYERAYSKVLAQLEEARANTKADYDNARRLAATDNQIKEKNYFENVANRGQTFSGSTAQGELALKIAGMNNQSRLDAEEAQALGKLHRDTQQAGSDYNYNVARSNADIELQRYKDLLDQYRLDEENAKKEAEKKLERETSTINQYYSDFTAEIQRREALDPNDELIPYLKIARQQKINDLENRQREETKELEKAQYDRAYKIFQDIGIVTEELAPILGLPVGTTTNSYRNTSSIISNRNKTSSSGGSSSGGTKETSTSTLNTIVNNVQKMLSETETILGGDITRAKYSEPDVIAYVLSQNISTQEKMDIIQNFGLTKYME